MRLPYYSPAIAECQGIYTNYEVPINFYPVIDAHTGFWARCQ